MKGTPSTEASVLVAASWLPVLRRALGTTRPFRCLLRGDSMEPTLPSGCEIEIAPLLARMGLGEIVVFVEREALVAHRVVRTCGERWTTQGDNRPWPDPPRHRGEALGVVVAAYLGDGRCWARSPSGLGVAQWLARHHLWRAKRLLRRGANRYLTGPWQ